MGFSKDNQIQPAENQSENQIQSSEKTVSDSFLTQLIELSVKTLFYLLLIIAVGIAAFSRIFPLATMRFYMDMDDYQTAVKYAKDQAERGGKNRYEALVEGIGMSEALLFEADNDSEARCAAEYLLYFTEEFAALEDFGDRCRALDEYHGQNAETVVTKVGFYSFKDYIFCLNTAARSVLKKTDKLLYDGGFMPREEKGYITQNELWLMFLNIEDKNISYTELAIIFNQISENLFWGDGSLIFDYQENDTTPLYDMMLQCIKNEEGYSYLDKVIPLTNSVRRLYFLQAAALLGENIKAFFESLTDWDESSDKISEAESVFSVGDEHMPLYEFYRTELLLYK